MPPRAPVLLLVPSLVRAGAETQAVSLANGLAASGLHVHLATFGDPLDLLDRVDREKVVFHRLQRRGPFGLSLVRQLAALMSEHRYAVVHCTLQVSLFYATLARLLTPAKAALVVAIHTTHNLSPREERFDRWLYRPLLARAARSVFVCQAQAAHWVDRFPELEGRAVVIYNGVDTAQFAPAREHSAAAATLGEELSLADGASVLVCVARLRPEKGHLLLLEALAEHADATVHLLLAGDGVMRQAIVEQASALGLTERVHLLGDVRDTRPLYALAAASVLASTSVETFSMAMLESLAMGTPMIATEMGGMGEAIRHGDTGWLVAPGDVPALTAAIAEATAPLSDAAKRGAAGRALVLESFTVQTMVRETAALLREVASECRTPAERSA